MSFGNTAKDMKMWSEENLQIGNLLLAVSVLQSFVENNWTSAQARQKSLPSSGMHFRRTQFGRSSMLTVHGRPEPDVTITVDDYIRGKKRSDAWELMKSVDAAQWTDICKIFSMIIAVDQNPKLFEDQQSILDEVDEARILMKNAQVLAAVDSIESFRQEELYHVEASSAIIHGSELATNKKHHGDGTIENEARRAECIDTWQTMNSCNRAEWTAASHYHSKLDMAMSAKKELIDRAVRDIQDFNTKEWTSLHLQAEEDPKWKATQIRRGSCLAVHEDPYPDFDDPGYREHRERLIEAWEVMRTVGPKKWIDACKSHEDRSSMKVGGTLSVRSGIIRTNPPVRNSVNGIAA